MFCLLSEIVLYLKIVAFKNVFMSSFQVLLFFFSSFFSLPEINLTWESTFFSSIDGSYSKHSLVDRKLSHPGSQHYLCLVLSLKWRNHGWFFCPPLLLNPVPKPHCLLIKYFETKCWHLVWQVLLACSSSKLPFSYSWPFAFQKEFYNDII